MSGHAWIEVDLGAVRHNYRQVRQWLGDGVRLIAVVKGNAYGHGLERTALALEAEGAELVAVTHVGEAARLSGAGLKAGILVLTPPRGEDAQTAAALGLDVCVMDAEGADELQAAAAGAGVTLGAHLKIDTGMGRLGVRPEGALDLARKVASCPNLSLNALFSHCAEGWSQPAAVRQLAVFQTCCETVERAGIPVGATHIAASAAALSHPPSRLNCVRIGTLLYGQFPTAALQRSDEASGMDLRPTWKFCSRIIAVRKLLPGASVGYGAEFQTSRVSQIAVVPVGMADGLGVSPDSLQRRGLRGAIRAIARPRFTLWARLRGERVPLVGRVAMQMCSIDVTDIPDAAVGEVVDLPVRRLMAGSSVPRIYSE